MELKVLGSAERIRRFDLPNVEARLEHWIDHKPSDPYNAILTFEAMEHFARFELSVEQKVEIYQTYFQRCHDWLVPSGLPADDPGTATQEAGRRRGPSVR